ncbi:hypothetical protein V1477_014802 [Vespula maculifrons]|uniref:Uncharacterized protein n=1 Tax=Vespula maculifrons TaxID=7453 RepID=A0ABD2BIH4_VESMC
MSDTAFNKARTRLCKPQVMLVHYAAPRENNSTDFPWSAVVSGDNRLPADDLEIAILSEVTVHRKQDSTVKKLQKTDRRSIRILFESRLEPTKTRPSFLVSEKSLLKNSADSPVDVLSRLVFKVKQKEIPWHNMRSEFFVSLSSSKNTCSICPLIVPYQEEEKEKT